MTKRPHRDLREACIAEALQIIEAEGVESLSLRDVARRLNVSHQAPYRHFPSREHILAEIIARAFDAFATYLDSHIDGSDPQSDMRQMGLAYLQYASEHPLQYRLMFGTPLPDGAAHPEMMAKAKHAFEMLCNGLRRELTAQKVGWTESRVIADALFIWSALHGLSGIMSSSVLRTLDVPPAVLSEMSMHLLSRISHAMARA
jgi:AcrR family transcriptional regulator